MASDPRKTNDLAIWKSSLSVDHMSSRLVKRGLKALDECRKIRLDVETLFAFGTSLFVFAKNWDHSAWDSYTVPPWHEFWSEPPDQRSLLWNSRRHLTFFEFHQTGAFIRKIELPLIRLTSEGFGKLLHRDCVSITIRSNFIYFREGLWMPGDPYTTQCHVHYLFSRAGERLAIWSNSPLVDRHRVHHEPKVPTAEWLDPDLIDDTSMMTLRPQDESLAAQPQHMWFKEQSASDSSKLDFVLTSQDVEGWIAHIARLQESSATKMQNSPLPPAAPTYRAVELPPSTSLMHYLRHVGMEPDPKALWLLGDERRENETLERSALRFDMDDIQAGVKTYPLPHPYVLARQGTITLLGAKDSNWMPSEADFMALRSEYESQFLADPDADCEGEYYEVLGAWSLFDTEYEGRYDRLCSWGDDLIVSTSFKNQQPEEGREVQILHFKLIDGVLYAVKRLDLGSTLDLAWRTLTFADGHLYYRDALEWDYDREAYDPTFRIVDVGTNTVRIFRPEVPESEMDPLDIPK